MVRQILSSTPYFWFHTQSKSDYSLFTKGQGISFIALLVYVDDIITTGASKTNIDALKTSLHSHV